MQNISSLLVRFIAMLILQVVLLCNNLFRILACIYPDIWYKRKRECAPSPESTISMSTFGGRVNARLGSTSSTTPSTAGNSRPGRWSPDGGTGCGMPSPWGCPSSASRWWNSTGPTTTLPPAAASSWPSPPKRISRRNGGWRCWAEFPAR